MQHEAELETYLNDELTAGLDRLAAEVGALERRRLRAIAECERRELWRRDGCRDLPAWLAARYGISFWKARRLVDCARALERLPLTSDALERGALSLDKVVELTRIATVETEAKLLAWARRVSPAAVRRRADRANRPTTDDARVAERARLVRWWWFDDGNRLGLEGDLPAEQGAVVARALRRAAERVPTSPDDDHETLEQRAADALVLLASQALASDSDSDRATVVVHRGLDDRGELFGELEDGPVLSEAVARMLACDARLQLVVTDRDGSPLGVGRATRNVPRWLWRALKYRDQGCTFPGCGSRSHLEAHHIVHWEDGGPTDLDNLTLVCSFHHRLIHKFGWRVVLVGDATAWFRPHGRRFDPGPDPPEPRPLVDEIPATIG